jgi:spermidine synthase
MNNKPVSNAPLLLILLLFFVSGALALVYEVVWSRMLMHVFGSTALAVGTVLAAFMSGMAIGSWRIGKIADRRSNCLRFYAQLEIGIALTALIAHLLLARIAPAHLAIHTLVGSYEPAFVVIRFLLIFVLIVAPTVLMGATLPVLTRFLAGRTGTIGIKLSTLYTTNTLGAVSGVLVTGFYLIAEYGIHLPVYLAVLANLLVGAIAWVASKRYPQVTQDATDLAVTAEETSGPGPVLGAGMYRLILAGLAVSGFTSFAYEIYWTRSLVFILGNSTYALTTMLSAFLTGIALGGYGIRFLLNRVPDRAVLFGWIQVCLGLFSALALPLLFAIDDPRALNQFVTHTTPDAVPLVMASFGIAFLVMLIPAMLIGATFPLVGQIGVREVNRTGSTVGRIYAINTLGNVLGVRH